MSNAIATKYRKRLYVDASPINGYGLYALQLISKHMPIFNIDGSIVIHPYEDGSSFEASTWIGFEDKRWINPSSNNPILFTNHSCGPNAIVSDNLKVISLKAISPKEEI